MDHAWRKSWKPSILPESFLESAPEPTDKEKDRLMKIIISATKEIRNLPYEPGAWSSRGQCLMQIGFPELSAGDAYKVTLLFDEIHSETSIGSTALLMFGMKHWLSMDPSSRGAAPTDDRFQANVWAVLKSIEINNTKVLIESLMGLKCYCDAQETCRDAGRKFPTEGYFRGSQLKELNEQKRISLARPMPSQIPPDQKDEWIAKIRCGGYLRRPYPWMTSEMLLRDPTAISRMKKTVADLTTKCNIRKIFASEGMDAANSDCYGMFAKTKIRTGEIVLREGTVICAAKQGLDRCPACCRILPIIPRLSECCGTPYCTTRCANLAARTYHASVCKKDFSSIHETVKPESHHMLILKEQLRVFALIVQENASHPLKASILAPLHAQLGPNNTMALCLRSSIIPIIKILRTFGIDIFADENWDTWVLFIILARIANNHRADDISYNGFIMAINPAYSFFNHSCDPNAQYAANPSDSGVTIVSTRPIAKGEEICISYLDTDNRELGVSERQKLLKPWVGERCFCQRCEKERNATT